MKTTNKAEVGDVISSTDFENLLKARDEHFNQAFNKKDLLAHKKLRVFTVNPHSKYDEGLEDNGIVSGNDGSIDTSFKVKPGKKFVVINAKWSGGGTGMGRHDVYPDAWQVIAKALKEDGSWNDKGIIIRFNQQTNCYSHTVSNVNLHKKMKMIFI
jgi:hypothetical protein